MSGAILDSARRALVACCALLAALAAAGCGYTPGLAPARPDGRPSRTIGISMFGNESLLPNLEWQLHQALSDAARRHTSLELVAPEVADIVIAGRVKAFRRQAGARTTGNRFVETREILTVEAFALDGDGGPRIARTDFEVGFGTAIDVPGREPAARANALRNSADRILLTLLAEVQYGIVRPPLPDAPGDEDPTASEDGARAEPYVGEGGETASSGD